MFRILYQDNDLIAIDKPSGFFVHPPEDQRFKISRSRNCLFLLKKQINQFLYPVHRLDRATSGVLLYALNSHTAKHTHEAFSSQKVNKTYLAVVRGWTHPQGVFDSEIKDEFGNKKSATTDYETLGKIELPIKNKKYSTSRYSLVKVTPRTGRNHQIRRHFANHSHPLVGDTSHGDCRHNQIFKNELNIDGLLLMAYSLELQHPTLNTPLKVVSKFGKKWHQIFDLFQLCAFTPR